jgi:hypothetical protein
VVGTSDRTDTIQWHLRPETADAIRSVRIMQTAM